MAWVEFLKDHDHRLPGLSSTHAYRAGQRCSVTRACFDEAVGLERAVKIRTPSKAEADRLAENPFHREAKGDRGG